MPKAQEFRYSHVRRAIDYKCSKQPGNPKHEALHFNSSDRHYQFGGMFCPASHSGPSDIHTEGWTFLDILNYFHFFVRSIIFREHQQLNKRISSEATRKMDGPLQSFRSPKNCHQQQFTACVQESINFAWGLLQSMVINPQKNKNRGRCLHMLKSCSFIKYCKQQHFTLDRDEGCISHVPATSLGEHAPSIRSLSWLTDWLTGERARAYYHCHVIYCTCYSFLPAIHCLG